MKNCNGFLMFVVGMLMFWVMGINCEKKPTAPVRNNPFDSKGIYKDMVYVPAGVFIMGSDSDLSKEKPVHTVYLDAFFIDKYEVSNQQYAAYLTEALANFEINADTSTVIRDGKELLDLHGSNCQISYFEGIFSIESGKQYYPVVAITWYGADAYAKHYGKRLPTEAEWEKAARGTDERTYPWGNDSITTSQCNFDSSNIGHTVVIGSYSPLGNSPYGCCDMAGNVWEWCNDWYDPDYYTNSPSNNPQGPSSGTDRVLRGGSWYDVESGLRCSNRSYCDPNDGNSNIGFRCVR